MKTTSGFTSCFHKQVGFGKRQGLLLAAAHIGLAGLAGAKAQTSEPHVQASTGQAAAIRNTALRDELARMVERDQEVRSRGIKNRGDKEIIAEWKRVDRANTARMRQIVAQYGWPGKGLVGSEGANNAFLLVQHADQDPAFQQRCLPLLQQAAQRGEAALPNLALLTDRVLLAQGKKQRYGSQFMSNKQGELVLRPTEDEAHLDERRHAMGLPPIAEYAQAIRQLYAPPKHPDAKEPPAPTQPPAKPHP